MGVVKNTTADASSLTIKGGDSSVRLRESLETQWAKNMPWRFSLQVEDRAPVIRRTARWPSWLTEGAAGG
eukprot:2352702-Prorocentrum_lima.AAC.1